MVNVRRTAFINAQNTVQSARNGSANAMNELKTSTQKQIVEILNNIPPFEMKQVSGGSPNEWSDLFKEIGQLILSDPPVSDANLSGPSNMPAGSRYGLIKRANLQ